MRRLLFFILIICLLISPSLSYAASHPQGNFVLAGGQYRVGDEADPFEKMDKTFFSSIIIPVKEGVINFSTTQPINLDSGSQHFTGTIGLILKGNYDKETGVISTQFNQNSDYTYERKSSAGTREGKGGYVFLGKAKGTVIDNKIVLSFEGKLSDKASSEADDKKVDTSSTSGSPWTKKVAFGTSEWVETAKEEPQEDTPRDSGVRFSNLSGQIEMWCPPNEGMWDVVKMHTIIGVDCHIKTGEDSTARISFPDFTTFDMKPETEIVLDTPPEKDSKLKLLAGNIWSNVKKMVKDGTMEVHMGQAVAGIKGTTFVLEEDRNTSTLKVIEGTVAFRSTATNEEKMVNSGQTISATSEGLGEIRQFDITAENKKWNSKVVETVQNQENAGKNSKNYFLPVAALIIVALGVVLLKKRKGLFPKSR